MKKLLFALACTAALFACSKEENGSDSRMPAPVVTLIPGETSIQVRWTAVDGASTYQVDYKLSSAEQWTESGKITRTEANISRLESNTSYDVRVKAIGADKESEWSEVKTCTTQAIPVSAPAAVAAADGNAIVVSWPAVDHAVSYKVEYKLTAAAEYAVATTTAELTYTISNLEYRTSYDVRVKTIGNGSESGYSQVITVVTGGKSEIATADDLIEFLASSSADVSGEYKLTADIDMGGKTVTPAADFGGTFDGQNHKISNLTGAAPLFARNSGTVKNLTIDASCSFAPADTIFGPVVRRNYGTLHKVVNKADVVWASDGNVSNRLFIAGVAGESYGPVKECVNEGAVTIDIKGSAIANGVAGIVAYQAEADIEDCENKGAITSKALYCPSRDKIYNYEKLTAPSAGGVVCFVYKAKVLRCDNYGAISLAHTAIDNATTGIERLQIGGVVGAPDYDVEDCKNFGDVDVKLVSTTRAAFGKGNPAINYIANVGGIAGGAQLSEGQNKVNMSGCVNSGKVTLDGDANNSYTTVAGIIGWPGTESSPTAVISNCSNSGAISAGGKVKIRLAGIAGGTGNFDGCTNTGNITIHDSNNGCYVGGIVGYKGRVQTLRNCTVSGCTIAYDGETAGNSNIWGLGGIAGNSQNQAGFHGFEGCSVSCTLSSNHTRDVGLIVGRLGGDSNEFEFGTNEAPVTIKKGSRIINTHDGITLTVDSENYTNAVSTQAGTWPANYTYGFLYGSLFYKADKTTSHLAYAE